MVALPTPAQAPAIRSQAHRPANPAQKIDEPNPKENAAQAIHQAHRPANPAQTNSTPNGSKSDSRPLELPGRGCPGRSRPNACVLPDLEATPAGRTGRGPAPHLRPGREGPREPGHPLLDPELLSVAA